MNLKWIKAANLMSIGNTPIHVDFNGYDKTLIVGKNGAGKSLLVEAISFLWFGKSYRKLTKAETVNTINKKNLVVEGEWESGGHTWKVKRGIKPDVLEVWKNDKAVDSAAAKRDFQQFIEDYALSFNYQSFKRVIALGTAGYKPFMDMTAPERRTFVEEILDIQVFSVMNKNNKDEIKVLKSSLQQAQSNRSVLEHKIHTNKSVLEKSKENGEEIARQVKTEITKLEQQVSDFIVEEDELSANIKTLQKSYDADLEQKLNAAISKINQLQGQQQSQLSEAQKSYDFFDMSATCPTCDQAITEDHKEKCFSVIEQKKEESEGMIEKLNEKLQHARDKMQTLSTAKQEISELQAKQTGYKRDIARMQSEINSKRNQYETLVNKQDDDTTDIIKQLREWNTERKQIKEREEQITEEIRDREMMTLVLKDDGVKSKIIENYLPIINGKVNEYLKIMEANYGFVLDQNFKETMQSRGRETMSFNNLSQGQRMRVDLALMFTWRDVVKLRTGSYTNVLIMDEIMDSATDEDGIIALRKIIDSLEDTNTIIISHSEKHNQAWFNRLLKVRTRGMFTEYSEIINKDESEQNLYE